MEPVFMYWNEIKFKGNDNFKEFTVNFSDGDNLNGVIFKKKKDYFITSMTANVEIDKDLTNLKDYKKIKEISEKSNEIIKKGIDHLNNNVILEIKLKDVDDLLPDKTKRKLSTKSLEYFDEKAKKNKTVSIYSQYEELKFFGLKFKKENGIIDKYTIRVIEDEKNNLFLQKKIFFDKNKLIEIIKKEYDYKNTFFMEYNGKLIAQTIGFTEFLIKNIEFLAGKKIDFFSPFKNRSNFPIYFYDNLFGGSSLIPTKTRPAIFTKGSYSNLTDRHPIAVSFGGNIAIKGGVNFYITQELYEKDHSIFKKIPEIPSRNVTTSQLAELRRQLNNDNFTVSKLYGFRNVKNYSIYPILNYKNFIIPDFYVDVKIKKEVDENIKKIFEGSFFILDNDYNTSTKTEIISASKRSGEIKNVYPEKVEENLNRDYLELKKLSDEINLKSYNRIYENFFLYDLENIIRPSFITELQEEFNIYGLINFSSKVDKEKKLKIISPKNYLKFEIERDVYKNQLKLELNKVHTKKTFNITDNNVFNFGILRTEKKIKIGEKGAMVNDIIDTITIIGIQKIEYSYINPVHIHIKSESIIRRLILKKNNKYRFVLKSLIFSSNTTNDTDIIFLISDGLSDARKIFINDKLESGIGICYLTEIKDWEIIKGESKRVQAVFSDSENFAGQSNHLSLVFETRNLSDILKFSITLVDGEGKPIKFKDGEDKIPIINFDIQIIK